MKTKKNRQYKNGQAENHRSSTTNHQREIHQVHSTTTETTPGPPGIENNETSEVQLNTLHCESIDKKSDTDKTMIINMLRLEHMYETSQTHIKQKIQIIQHILSNITT